MQFFILLTGVMVFMFYQFEKPPVYFKEAGTEAIMQSQYSEQFRELDSEYTAVFEAKKDVVEQLASQLEQGAESVALVEQAQNLQIRSQEIRGEVKELLVANDPEYETKDSDYVFLTFIINYLPHGVIGLLLAVIFSAAMSSTSSELNALGTTSTVDFYKRLRGKEGSERHYLITSKLLTLLWGLIAISFALFASQAENLIEGINIVASLFYGAPLGIFLVAFILPYVKGTAVFWGAVLAEFCVLTLHFLTTQGVISLGYLWYNVVGLILVVIFSLLIQGAANKKAGF
jgi:Na+(H+)/acetate symporter ActP